MSQFFSALKETRKDEINHNACKNFPTTKWFWHFSATLLQNWAIARGLALFKDLFSNRRNTQYYTIFIGRTEVLSYHIKPNVVFLTNSYDNIKSYGHIPKNLLAMPSWKCQYHAQFWGISKSVNCQKMPMYEQLKSQLLVNSNVWHNTHLQGAHGVPMGPPIGIHSWKNEIRWSVSSMS